MDIKITEQFKESLREKWESEKDFKQVGKFCKENSISHNYFRQYIGGKGNLQTREKIDRINNHDKDRVSIIKDVSPDQIKEARKLFTGNNFQEVYEATGINISYLFDLFDKEWQEWQIRRNLYSKNNIYNMSIADMCDKKTRIRVIADRFSVKQGLLIRILKEEKIEFYL